ncbi:MAG: hypothetical protein HOQ28_07835 [Thermoleophilia bacterium]|nr:hypothetical protein [Thermoleophilia bacterium]
METFEAAEARGVDRVAEVAEYLDLPIHLVQAPVRAVDVLLPRFSGEEDFGNLVEWL